MKKFELTENYKMCFGHKLFQIRALVTIKDVVEAGEIGGCIEKEDNLSQTGNSWVSGNACVFGNARVSGNACVRGNAHVFENACVSGNAVVTGNSRVSGNSHVSGDSLVYENAWVAGDVTLSGTVWVSGDAFVSGDAHLHGDSYVSGDARVYCDADVLHIIGLGTAHRSTTAYKTEEGIEILCGCFRGGVEAFKDRVVNTRSGKVREEYLKFAELINIYFG